MLQVTATRLRSSAPSSMGGATSAEYTGYLLAPPAIGQGLVIYRDPHGRRMITSAVRRIMRAGEDGSLYIETDNSMYRLHLCEMPTQVAAG